MRTTIDIPDETYRRLRVKAATDGQTIREIALRGIQRELEEGEKRPVQKLQLPLIASSRPGTLALTNEQIDELTAFS
jgi:plasmid stability protein